jgi:hypothetical protein
METMMRVPLMQGLPWQTSGSTETRFRQSGTFADDRFLAMILSSHSNSLP